MVKETGGYRRRRFTCCRWLGHVRHGRTVFLRSVRSGRSCQLSIGEVPPSHHAESASRWGGILYRRRGRASSFGTRQAFTHGLSGRRTLAQRHAIGCNRRVWRRSILIAGIAYVVQKNIESAPAASNEWHCGSCRQTGVRRFHASR